MEEVNYCQKMKHTAHLETTEKGEIHIMYVLAKLTATLTILVGRATVDQAEGPGFEPRHKQFDVVSQETISNCL